MKSFAAIMTFPTHRAAIDRARDIFLFSCFTGLRFSDVIGLRWSNIDGDMLDCTAQKTNHRQRFALATEALRIIAKYPKSPDDTDPHVFPQISNQKYNAHLKEVGKLAGMTGDWITEKQSGREKTREVRPKYEPAYFSRCPAHICDDVSAKRNVARRYTRRHRTHHCRHDDEVCEVRR